MGEGEEDVDDSALSAGGAAEDMMLFIAIDVNFER